MKIFPFYTSTAMRDAERVSSQDALLCPVWHVLPFQIQRDHLADTYLTEVKLVDCDANETDIFNYFHGSEDLLTGWTNFGAPFDFDTFISTGSTILTAIEAGSALASCYSNEFALATGESVMINYDLTLNSGDLPNLLLGSVSTAYSPRMVTVAGGHIALFTATGNTSGNVRFVMENEVGNDTSFACTFSKVARTNLVLNEFTTYDFLTYNGEPLSTTLPYGVYYLKLSDGNTTWYSDWFNVQNIQPIVSTGWSSDTFGTFTTSGMDITSAISTGAAFGATYAFNIRTDEKFVFTHDLISNSGVLPLVRLAIGGAVASANYNMSNGLNEIELTATKSGSAFLAIVASAATNFSASSISLRRKAGDYVHLEFTNARDFNNGDESIYYVGGFTQQAYLRAYLNLPSHETIETGDDKNGEFVAEKVIRKYTRSILSYETRAMYNALGLLKLHDSLKILDEVGIEYTPQIGNVDVSIDWDTFDTGSLRIAFNEDGNVWTNSMDNIV